MPLALDGTSRHEDSYVHSTLGGTSSPDQLAIWWLLGGSEEWATLYTAAQEVDFGQQLWDASKVVFQDTSGADQETLFFLCAGGKAQILMANCKNSKAEVSQAMAIIQEISVRNRVPVVTQNSMSRLYREDGLGRGGCSEAHGSSLRRFARVTWRMGDKCRCVNSFGATVACGEVGTMCSA